MPLSDSGRPAADSILRAILRPYGTLLQTAQVAGVDALK
jgi:hypothetical protein